LTEKWWFKLSAKLIGPAAVFAFLVLLGRNIQNGAAWNDASWALILPLGLILAIVLLSRAKWEWAPVIEGAPPRPPWQIVFAKATAKFLTVIVSGVLVCRLALTSLETWPVLNKSLDSTGLKDFAAAVGQDARMQIAGLLVLFALLYWRTNTVTRPEYVWPDGTPVVGARYAGAAALTTKSNSAYPTDNARRISWSWRIALVATIGGAILWIVQARNGAWPSLTEMIRSSLPSIHVENSAPARSTEHRYHSPPNQVSPPVAVAPPPPLEPRPANYLVLPAPMPCWQYWGDQSACFDVPRGFSITRRMYLPPGTSARLWFPEIPLYNAWRLRSFGDHIFIADCRGYRVDVMVGIPNDGVDIGCGQALVLTERGGYFYINTR
jgi:hypothetical protein